MTPLPNPRPAQEKLERFVHRALRDLPERPAPRSLEQRVLAEISRRAALPWWRQSYPHWPGPARAAFLFGSLGVAGLVFLATGWAVAGFDTSQFQNALLQPVLWWEGGRTVLNAILGAGETLLRSIPPLWLYGGLAFIAMMYATLIGLGAAAYKVFRADS
jgi:anti-sigma factor RsiW